MHVGNASNPCFTSRPSYLPGMQSERTERLQSDLRTAHSMRQVRVPPCTCGCLRELMWVAGR